MNAVRIGVILLATTIGASTAVVGAEDVAVVVNRANPVDNLSSAQLRKMLLAEVGQWPNGKKVAVLMTAPGQGDRESTLKRICGMNETDFNLHFMHAAFTGQTVEPPKALAPAQLLQSVAGSTGALAFVKVSAVDASVKIVKVDGVAPGQPGYKIATK